MKMRTVQMLVKMTVILENLDLVYHVVIDIFIGNDMSDVHVVHPEHLKRLSAQRQGFFK